MENQLESLLEEVEVINGEEISINTLAELTNGKGEEHNE